MSDLYMMMNNLYKYVPEQEIVLYENKKKNTHKITSKNHQYICGVTRCYWSNRSRNTMEVVTDQGR